VIRGAFVLAVGLGIGYVKGLHENETILNKLEDMVKRFNAFLDEQVTSPLTDEEEHEFTALVETLSREDIYKNGDIVDHGAMRRDIDRLIELMVKRDLGTDKTTNDSSTKEETPS
jgi:hypothetical protein